ncbi:MAG: sulfotransferase [Deltaproteobacteria bacterium]|nr:sulfotransferase [Deltaproteobacteria bacterium]
MPQTPASSPPPAGPLPPGAGVRPGFLIIGAQKAGTSWLASRLAGHPEAWLPPIKEVHYFDGLWNLEMVTAQFNHFLAREVAPGRAFNGEILDFFRRFVLEGPKDDAWYRGLFTAAGPRLAGEATPAYSILPPADIARVHALLPRVKVILLLRDPLERAWSHFKFDAARHGRNPAIVPLPEILAHLDSPGNEARTRYLAILENWARGHPGAPLLLAYYDDLRGRPEFLLAAVCRFLGLAYDPGIWGEELGRVVNPSAAGAPPPAVLLHLARKYAAEIEVLASRLGGPVLAWRERCRRVLAGG